MTNTAQKRTSFFKRTANVILPIFLLAAVFLYVSPRELLDVFKNIKLEQLFLLFFASFVLIWLSCIKWRMFINASGQSPKLFYLIKLYVLGYFVNLVSPSTIGGDLVRSYQLGKTSGRPFESLSATFLERFTGLMAMSFLAIAAVVAGSQESKGLELPVFLFFFIVAVGSFICFTSSGIILFESIIRIFIKFLHLSLREQIEKLTLKIKSASEFARHDLTLILKTLAVSIIFHLCTIWNTKIAADCIGWDTAPIGGLLVVVPLVLIVSAIPLTPSGIGVQEGAFVFLLQRIGATREEALAVALLLRAKSIVLGLLGGIVWFSIKDSNAPGDSNAT